MKRIVLVGALLAVAACGRPDSSATTQEVPVAAIERADHAASAERPGARYLGLWENHPNVRMRITEEDGVFLLRNVGQQAGVLTSINVLPLTLVDGQLKTNSYMGDIAVVGDELYFGGLTFRRVEEAHS